MNGNQCYKCEACICIFQLVYTYKAREPGIKKKLIDMPLTLRGIQDTSRVLKINMNTVISTLKKSELNPVNKLSLCAYRVKAVHSLEADGQWSYVQKKRNPRWLWVDGGS
jgi:hypothetical protein